MFFKFLVWFCRVFSIEGGPVCRVWNDTKTNSYTLYNTGWVVIRSTEYDSTDALFITQISPALLDKFNAEFLGDL